MKQKELQPDTFIIKNCYVKSVEAALKRYDIYLEERRSELKEGRKSKQKHILQCKIDQLKLQKNSLQDLSKLFNEEFVKSMEQGEKKMDLERDSKANALKRNPDEKGREIDDPNKALAII